MNDMIEKPKAAQEITGTGDGRDITRPYTSGLLLPYDRILSGRGGNDLKIYEQVLSDPQVKTVFEQRRKAVTQASWQVDAGGERPIDLEAAEFLRLQLEKIGWDNVTDKMLYGLHYGFSVAEILYEVQGNKLGWKAIKVRNRRRFKYDVDNNLRLITPKNISPGELLSPPYFWEYSTGSDNDDEPYGVGLGHWLYWPVLFKRNGIKFWLMFLEKFGMPTVVGKYDSNAGDPEKSKLLAAIRAIQSDSGVIMPKEMQLDLLEAARGGTADYKALHDTMDEIIAKAVLGQTMTSQDGSSESQANVHMDVRQDIIKGDSDLNDESFNLGPVKWLIERNYPTAALPRVYRMLEAEEDISKQAEIDLKVIDMGFEPEMEYVHQTYGAHWVKKQRVLTAIELQAAKPVPVDEPVATSFAEKMDPFLALRKTNADKQQAIVNASIDLADSWEKFIGPRMAELQTLLDETNDVELFKARLIEMAGAEPNAEFVLALQKAGFSSHLLARATSA